MTDHPHRDDATRQVCAGGRPQPYRAVHRALRARLLRQLRRVDAVPDAADVAARARLAREAHALLDLCLARQHAEDREVHALLAGRAPRATLPYDDDHVEQRREIASLRAAADALADGLPTPAAALRGHALAWARFGAALLEHMADEETRLTAALWAHCCDAELRALGERLDAAWAAALR